MFLTKSYATVSLVCGVTRDINIIAFPWTEKKEKKKNGAPGFLKPLYNVRLRGSCYSGKICIVHIFICASI